MGVLDGWGIHDMSSNLEYILDEFVTNNYLYSTIYEFSLGTSRKHLDARTSSFFFYDYKKDVHI